jgi:hypothetical protein
MAAPIKPATPLNACTTPAPAKSYITTTLIKKEFIDH